MLIFFYKGKGDQNDRVVKKQRISSSLALVEHVLQNPHATSLQIQESIRSLLIRSGKGNLINEIDLTSDQAVTSSDSPVKHDVVKSKTKRKKRF